MNIGAAEQSQGNTKPTGDGGGVEKAAPVCDLRHLTDVHHGPWYWQGVEQPREKSAEEDHPVVLTRCHQAPAQQGGAGAELAGSLTADLVGNYRAEEGARDLAEDESARHPGDVVSGHCEVLASHQLAGQSGSEANVVAREAVSQVCSKQQNELYKVE